jgi:hypothetical protein
MNFREWKAVQKIEQGARSVREHAALGRAKVREYAELGRDRVREYWRIALLDENAHYMAAAGYIPFIGWLAPLYLKENSAFCQHHGKNGFYVALVAIAIVFALMLLNVFTPRDSRILRLLFIVAIYLAYVAYFTFCGFGVNAAVRKREFPVLDRIPYMDRVIALIQV